MPDVLDPDIGAGGEEPVDRYEEVAGTVTCMPDVLDPDIGAGGEEEPVV
jgi:hypothetical protein